MAKKSKKKVLTIAEAMAKAASTDDAPARIVRAEDVPPRYVLPSGHENLDAALGIGGYPMGRIVTLVGKPGCGKTTLAIEAVIECQRRGGIGVLLDFESKFELSYAYDLGVDPENFIVQSPSCLEAGLKACDDLLTTLREHDPDMPAVIIWDSVNTSKSKMSSESDWDSYNFASESRIMSDKLPRLGRKIAMTNALLIGISQMRIKMEGKITSNKIAVGNAWEHQTPVVISWVKSKKERGKTSEPSGQTSTVQIIKNQVGSPFREAELYMRYGSGYDRMFSLLQAGLDSGVITRSGAWFNIADAGLGQGIEKSCDALRDDPELAANIRSVVRAGYASQPIGSTYVDEE